MVCGVVISSLKTMLILQPANSDVKIGPAGAHVNRLIVKFQNFQTAEISKQYP